MLLDVVERGAEVAGVVKIEVEDGGVDVNWSLSVVDVSSVVSGVVSVTVIVVGAGHTCKKRVMLRRRLFWPKKICGKSA